jgi:hypothetical protein
MFTRFIGGKTPVARVAVPVGPLAAVLRDGDRLIISRGACGETAVLLVRDEERLAGFGSVVGTFTPGVRSDDDPRAHEAARAFIDGLPSSRPDDLWIRFSVSGATAMLREREYQELPPWQLYVHDVSCYGEPGRPSHVGIVHASLGMSREAVIDTSNRVASGVTFLR